MPPKELLTHTSAKRAGIGSYSRPKDLEPLGINEPALQIHGIGTGHSPEIWLGIPHGSRAPKSTIAPLRIVKFSGPMLTTGVDRTRIDGVPAWITSPARTIIDCLRLSRLIDRETAMEAIREGVRGRHVTTNALLRMAKECGVLDRTRCDIELLSS